MTAHDQHAGARQPTEEREVLDYPDAEPNFSAAEADPSSSHRERGALETEPPPLETGSPASDRQFDTEATRQPTETEAYRSAEPTTGGDLFADDELAGLRARWDNVQAGFVDDPRECVHKADSLVSDVVEQLTSGFAAARARLEEQWGRGEQASTEDLRVALTQYREFFQRLLAV
jgi:hypothetical protein